MKMLGVLPLFIVALCAMGCYVSAAPRYGLAYDLESTYEPQNELEPTYESEQDREPTNEPQQTLELLETRGRKGIKKEGKRGIIGIIKGAMRGRKGNKTGGMRGRIGNKKKGPCPSGWMKFEEYCYLASDYGQNWQKSQDKCSVLDAEVVKINSPEENEFVLQLVREKAPTAHTVWIGLFWDSNSQSWAWGDNSDPVYLNWNEDEPNGNAAEPCGEMYTSNVSDFPINGYWNDVPCNQPKGLVCKKLA